MACRMRLLLVLIATVMSCADSTGVVLGPGEKVVGRTRGDGRVRLLTTKPRLLSVRLSDGSAVSQPISGLEADEAPWGLALTSDGLVTLVGPATIARLSPEGQVTDRVALQRPQLGLFGLGESVLLQPATLVADEAVLRRVRLPDGRGESVGSLRSSPFETRAETLARNLVGCGSTQVDELPCWSTTI